eukprot:scaffold1159_cov68-Phaeocystis_antarctica.AAC.5
MAAWPLPSAACSAERSPCARSSGGPPVSFLQVDARLVLEKQAHQGVLAHLCGQHEGGAVLGGA